MFLEMNGWEVVNVDSEYTSFGKMGNAGFDIDNESITVIGDIGDVADFNIDHMCRYTLLGYMIQNHIIGMDYKWPKIK